ncbi:MAG: tetraacyldisaccharide 4'-kinase [Flavobacteriaceae bacterium]
MQLLRKIAFPVSLIYGMVVFIRNFLYDIGVFSSSHFKTPILCIGNLSVGGTGKTPMVEYLISVLKSDYKIAVLSRGYKRKSKGYVLATKASTVEDLGDEPYQVYTKFPEISMAVDKDRRHGILVLAKNRKPDIILLDDAFQHRKVKPHLSILLTSFDNLYCDDWYLPTGDLRDSKREAKRADLLIVTKCPADLSEGERSKIEARLGLKANQKVLFSFLVYDENVLGSAKMKSLKDLTHKKITLVTGIADPAPLVNHLMQKGLVFEHLKFGDHHFFTKEELQHLNTKEVVLTTEKDFVRLKGKVPNLSYIAVKHAFMGDNEVVLKKTLDRLMLQPR